MEVVVDVQLVVVRAARRPADVALPMEVGNVALLLDALAVLNVLGCVKLMAVDGAASWKAVPIVLSVEDVALLMVEGSAASSKAAQQPLVKAATALLMAGDRPHPLADPRLYRHQPRYLSKRVHTRQRKDIRLFQHSRCLHADCFLQSARC
ncbi:hypothetical protein V7S43_000177 [Phytophthora oleae]|uniref:Uncharacterized protein n=1 Tax=Phytophthora oleae TaxID=2107226 RepID=A0ABD3G6Z4_9STRA